MLQENPGTTQLQFKFKVDSDREEVMKTIETIRATSIYPHPPLRHIKAWLNNFA